MRFLNCSVTRPIENWQNLTNEYWKRKCKLNTKVSIKACFIKLALEAHKISKFWTAGMLRKIRFKGWLKKYLFYALVRPERTKQKW